MSTRALEAYRQNLSAVDRERAELVAGRDAMIREDHERGATIAELSRATGLTRTMLYKIIEKEPNA